MKPILIIIVLLVALTAGFGATYLEQHARAMTVGTSDAATLVTSG